MEKIIFVLTVCIVVGQVSCYYTSCTEGEVVPTDDFGCNTKWCEQGGWMSTYYDCITNGSSRYLNITSYKGSKYAISLEEKYWKHGREFCKNLLNGDLASFETSKEWQHVYDEIVKHDPKKSHWLGGSAAEDGHGGQWFWVTGEKLLSRCHHGGGFSGGCGISNFNERSPNNPRPVCLYSDRINEYAIMDFDRNWDDGDCDFRKSFICEYKADQNEDENGDDGDGDGDADGDVEEDQ